MPTAEIEIMNGTVRHHVGGVTVLSDVVAVEEIEVCAFTDNPLLYYRLTFCTDEGVFQSTWSKDKTPPTVFQLIKRLDARGSHIRADGMLVGPHLMRNENNRDIIPIKNRNSVQAFKVEEDEHVHMELEWLDHILRVGVDIYGDAEDDFY